MELALGANTRMDYNDVGGRRRLASRPDHVASTFCRYLSLLGAASNVIILEEAEGRGTGFGSFEFAKVGILVTISIMLILFLFLMTL